MSISRNLELNYILALKLIIYLILQITKAMPLLCVAIFLYCITPFCLRFCVYENHYVYVCAVQIHMYIKHKYWFNIFHNSLPQLVAVCGCQQEQQQLITESELIFMVRPQISFHTATGKYRMDLQM